MRCRAVDDGVSGIDAGVLCGPSLLCEWGIGGGALYCDAGHEDRREADAECVVRAVRADSLKAEAWGDC